MPGPAFLDAATTTFDVVVVGAGPSGSSCALWLASAGWSVALVEKKTFPRVKTCGDGLTPRSVHQLAAMGLEDKVAAHGHRYGGLRAFGFGASLEMAWPEHPVFPNYGYTITRFDLDGLVADEAAVAARSCSRASRRCRCWTRSPRPPARSPARRASWSPTRRPGPAARSAGASSSSPTARTRGWAANWAPRATARGPWAWRCAATTARERHAEPWIDSHLDIRDPEGKVVPGYGWIFPLGDGRVNVGVGLLSTDGAWRGVNTTKLQEYFVARWATPGG